MADNNDYLREKRKSVLREGMISNPLEDGRGQALDSGPGEPPRFWKKLTQGQFLGWNRMFVFVAAVIGILTVVGVAYNSYLQHKTYSSYAVAWQKPLDGTGAMGYAALEGYLLKYSRDGIVCYSQSGEQLWNQSYEMKSPMVHISGEYAVVADQMGYSIYICGMEGCTGQITTNQPITRVQVASQGVVAAILENTRSNQIVFYDKGGKKLDIELKTLIEEYGYPMDIALSPDGQQLAVAYIYMDAGTMMNKVVFYNFEVGKSRQDRVVGIFMEYQSAMIAEVDFLNDQAACAFADDRVDFYSLKNSLSPALLQSHTYDGRKILSVFTGKNYAGVIVEAESGKSDRNLYVYHASGAQAFDKPVAMHYINAEISESCVLLYNDTNCLIYDMGGGLVYQGSLEGGISACIMKSRNSLYQIGGQVLSELKLK